MMVTGENGSRRVAVFTVLLLALLVSRLPFLNQILVSEEGDFAALVAYAPSPSQLTDNGLPQMIKGRIGDTYVYSHFGHDITPYLLIERTVGAVVRGLRLDPANQDRVTVATRSAFFALFLTGTVGLLWLAAPSRLGVMIALFMLSTPLAFGSSIQAQLDGSAGVAAVGLATALLLVGGRAARPWALIASGFLIGSARHEVAMAFAAATLAILVLQTVLKSPARGRIGLFALGLGLGTAAAILISPEDYRQGLGTMAQVYGQEAPPIVQKLRLGLLQQFFVWPVWLFLAASAALLKSRYRAILDERPEIILVTAGAAAIAFGFMLSGWTGDGFPRYFMPPLVALSYVLCVLVHDGIAVSHKAMSRMFGVLIAGAAINFGFELTVRHFDRSITSAPGTSCRTIRESLAQSAEIARSQNRIVLEQSSFMVYYPGLDFMNSDLGKDRALYMLQQKYPRDAERLYF